MKLSDLQQRILGQLIYWILGCCSILPWNSFIAANDYFQQLYPGFHIERVFTVAYLPCLLIVQAIMTTRGTLLSSTQRVTYGLVGFIFTLIFVSTMNAIFTAQNSENKATFALTILSSIMIGCFGGLLQGAVFEDAAKLDTIYTKAVVAGTAISGVLISVLRLISKRIGGDSFYGLKQSSLVYFFTASFICLLGVLGYTCVLPRLDVLKYPYRLISFVEDQGTQQLNSRKTSQQDDSEEVELYIKDGTQRNNNKKCITQDFTRDHSQGSVSHILKPQQQGRAPKQARVGVIDDQNVQKGPEGGPQATNLGNQESDIDGQDANGSLLKQKSHDSLEQQSLLYDLRQTFSTGQVQYSCWAIFGIYIVTTSIFPGVLAEDLKFDQLGDWYPLFLILIFNLGDLVGKLAPQKFLEAFKSGKSNFVASTIRALIMIPWYIVMIKTLNGQPALVMVSTLILGISNGFQTSCVLTQGSKDLSITRKQKSQVENLLYMFLILGLAIGAFTGWLWIFL